MTWCESSDRRTPCTTSMMSLAASFSDEIGQNLALGKKYQDTCVCLKLLLHVCSKVLQATQFPTSFFNGVPTKAGKAGIDHQHDHSYHLLLVGSDSQVSLDTQPRNHLHMCRKSSHRNQHLHFNTIRSTQHKAIVL